MQSTLYIMCGLPFSGKTTIAKQLAKKQEFSVVSVDDIRESLGFYWEKNEASKDDWEKIFKTVELKITSLLKSGNNVIYDSANQDKASRIKFKELAISLGVKSRVVFVDTPMKVILERYSSNLNSKERFHLPEKYFNAAVNTFEPPTEDEDVIKPEQLLSS